ncbi:MAG: hypothetical protein KDC44_02250, partial [Phaeodactylibacter sp.]|nr:hypothetical protein [Phaeodactylibacter sp.]
MKRPPIAQTLSLLCLLLFGCSQDAFAIGASGVNCTAAFIVEEVSDLEVVVTDVSEGLYDLLEW